MLHEIIPSISSLLTLTIAGLIFGLILSVAKQKLKVDRDPRIDSVLDALPGANCGACGQPGCAGYATKIVEDGMEITLCPVGGADSVEKISKIMGIEINADIVPTIARVHCQGGINETTKKFIYEGPKNCTAANELMGGFKTCEFGCLGFGECVEACNFDAIYMGENGLPIVIPEKCTGCGKCVEACPRDIISLVPENFDVYVMCKNEEKAPIMKKGCSVGCIGCKLCEKACKEVQKAIQVDVEPDQVVPAITVNNFLASIDYNLCTNCYKCVEVCPVPVINPITKSKKYIKMQEKKLAESMANESEKVGADA